MNNISNFDWDLSTYSVHENENKFIIINCDTAEKIDIFITYCDKKSNHINPSAFMVNETYSLIWGIRMCRLLV